MVLWERWDLMKNKIPMTPAVIKPAPDVFGSSEKP